MTILTMFDLADICSCMKKGQPWGVQASPVLLPVPQMLTQISLTKITGKNLLHSRKIALCNIHTKHTNVGHALIMEQAPADSLE